VSREIYRSEVVTGFHRLDRFYPLFTRFLVKQAVLLRNANEWQIIESGDGRSEAKQTALSTQSSNLADRGAIG
jgi:hypothetical protein